MNISDFARSRSVDPQAVSRYILRHPELQKLTTRVGKTVELTPEAEHLLNEVYPLPQPVQVIQGIPTEEYETLQKKYAAALEKLSQVQEARLEDQKRIAAGETAQLLLTDREKQLQEVQQRLEEETARAVAAEEAVKTAAAAATEAEREINRLRTRGLWARIRNT